MDYTALVTAIQDYAQNDETTFVNHLNDFIITAEDRIFTRVQMPAFFKSDVDRVCVDGTAEYTLDPGVIDIFSVRVSEGTTSQSTAGVQFGPVRYLLRKDYDFMLEAFPGSSSGKTATITGITKANPAVVSATNTFSNDDLVYIDGVSNMLVDAVSVVNGKFFRVSSVDSSSFQLTESGTVLDTSSVNDAGSGGSATSGFTTGVPEYYSVSSSGVSGSDPTMTIRLAPAPDAAYPITVDYYGKTTADSITSGVISGATSGNKTWLSVTAPETLLYGALVEAYTYMKGSPDLVTNYENHFNQSVDSLKALVEGRTLIDAYRSGQKQTRIE